MKQRIKKILELVRKWLNKEDENLEDNDIRHCGHRHIKFRSGTSKKKMVFAFVLWIISFLSFLSIGIIVFGQLYGCLMSTALWMVLVGETITFFLLSVPKVAGLVTVNLVDGYMESYGTGIHFKYPWEQVEKSNYISTRLVTLDYKEDFPSQDGPVVIVKWSIQYRPTIEGLPLYVSVDESTIHDGFGAIASSFLSYRISDEPALRAREKVDEFQDGMKTLFEKTPAEIREMNEKMFSNKIENLNEKIREKEERIEILKKELENITEKESIERSEISNELNYLFEEKDRMENSRNTAEKNLDDVKRKILIFKKEKDARESKGLKIKTMDECVLEEEYGIDLLIVSLKDTNFEQRYQDVRSTDKIAKDIDSIIDRMIEKSKKEGKPLTREKAYNNVLILNKNANKEIVETEGEGGNALASLLMGTFRQKK